MCTEPQRVGVGTWDCLERGWALESVAVSWGPPAPPPTHTPALGRPLTGLRAQVDSIWKAWLFQELLDQAGKGPEKNYVSMGGSGEKDRGLKTKDSGCQWKTAPYPYTSLALTSHRKPHNTRGFDHTSPVSLKPFLPFFSPEVPIYKDLWAAASHISF